jgi:2-dehydro-3-deoxy-D-arabinonate dehydratase
MPALTHIGQYWSSARREVRLVGCTDVALDPCGRLAGVAFDLSDAAPLAHHRRGYRAAHRGADWRRCKWTYSSLPFPALELIEGLEAGGAKVEDWSRGLDLERGGMPRLDLAALDREPSPGADHLVAPVIPRRAQAFGVTYLNSALERETEGRRGDYGFVYRAVKDRGERPEIFVKGTAPEHIVGPGGRMGLRSDLTNSLGFDGRARERLVVSAGIEPELAAVVYSSGEIWGYTLANDVSGNRIENETLLYLYQAKHFTGGLVLGPLVLLSREQDNPNLEITTRIFARNGRLLFSRTSSTRNLNAPLRDLIASAASHVRLTPGEVFSTGTDVVPDGDVKVLDEGMRVEISCPQIGILRHGAARVRPGEDLNLDYSRLEFEGRLELENAG